MPRLTDLSSTALIKTCLASADERAWTEFIRRFHSVIAATVLRTARHYEEPTRSEQDELIQDAYLKLCENDFGLLRSFKPRQQDSFYGYMKVITANIVHDHYKSVKAVKRGSTLVESIAEPEAVERRLATTPDSSERVSQKIQLEQIDRVLLKVTAGNDKDQEKKRIIFWLRHRQGLTAGEIASIPSLGLTTEGVESVLLRLAVLIRNHFAESNPHREVKVLRRQNRSKRLGS